MQITLFLRPHCAKYLQEHVDCSKAVDLSKPFGRLLIKTLIEKKPGRPLNCPDDQTELTVKLPTTWRRNKLRCDRRHYVVNPSEMNSIDKYLDELFRFEIMTAIQSRGAKQKKQVFLDILDRYQMTLDDISLDALQKFEQRYKNKSAGVFIFGR